MDAANQPVSRRNILLGGLTGLVSVIAFSGAAQAAVTTSPAPVDHPLPGPGHPPYHAIVGVL